MTRGQDPADDLGATQVAIDLPAGWHQVTPVGAWPLIARPRRWSGACAPNVTVVVTRTPGVRTLGEYTEAQLAGVHATIGGHLVHLDAGHRPLAHLDLVLATEQTGTDLTVAQRHVLDLDPVDGSGCRAVVATGLSADRDWSQLAGALLASVHSVRAGW